MTLTKFTSVAAIALSVGTMAQADAPIGFDSPEEAVEAVLDALYARDRDALIAIFGDGSEDVLFTGEVPRDRAAWTQFVEQYLEGHFIHVTYGDTASLFVGDDNWAFPAPIILGEDGKWTFDAEEAREEVLTRRIGRNELEVIEILHGYVDAQAEYRMEDHDDDGVLEFAGSILSSPGTRDGLYWPGGDSPIGDFVAEAAADGYSIDGEDQDPIPYAGYYYRLLTKQGENAPGGAMEYVINGNQVAGHALLAIPASYGDTGIMSFMVSESGVVMEADLGEDTLEKAVDITSYNPGEGWISLD